MSFDTDVLIVGGGPAGLLTALTLAVHGTKCILVERNRETTQWPKMDLTNCRSMEILRRLGVADGWREIGVPTSYDLAVHFSTGLVEGGETIAKWDLPSPDAWRETISQSNDGSQPLEPYQRGSQSLFEAFLRQQLEGNSLVDVRYGVKFEELRESENGVMSSVTDETGTSITIASKYLVGCDGGGSRVRRCLGIESIGGPVPGNMHLIHFQSHDTSVLHRQGRFWHCFLTGGAVLVSQDEDSIWTLHTPTALDTDITTLDPHQVISKAISGSFNTSVPIKIDRVLVSSTWRPNVYLSARYTSPHQRIFLAGDSAHQTVPAGGYGMNTAVGDSFDIGWKLSAVLKGDAGPELLSSYEAERRPVAEKNLEQAKKNWGVHGEWWGMAQEARDVICQQSAEGGDAREKIKQFVETHDMENRAFGLELDYRYRESPIIARSEGDEESTWDEARYTPSTWPGIRAPSVWSKDGKQNIHHLLGQGPEFTLVDFSQEGFYADAFARESEMLEIPLRVVRLPEEDHARKIWERDAVLVRPDDHVAWRSDESDDGSGLVWKARSVLKTALGWCA